MNIKSTYSQINTEMSYPKLRQQDCQVVCDGAGPLRQTTTVSSASLPSELEWGQVLVRIMYAPVDAADSYISATGGSYGGQTAPQPFVGGQHGIGVVAKVSSTLWGVPGC